jgi:hypothetical protein
MKTNPKPLFFLLALVFCTFILRAQGIDDMVQQPGSGNDYLLKHLSVSVKASTLGGGLEVATTLSNQFNLRLAGNYLKTGQNFTFTLLDLDASLKLGSVTLLADWHPGGRDKLFHLTGGLLYAANEILLTGVSEKSYRVGGYTITPDDLGELTMKLYTRKINPYLGLGFGQVVPVNRVSFKFELGTVFHGEPKVDMDASGMIARTGDQGETVAGNVSGYKFWPVMSMQLCFRLF